MKAIATWTHKLHRHHPAMTANSGYFATLCGQVVEGRDQWLDPKSLTIIAAQRTGQLYKICRRCFGREDLQEMSYGIDPVNEPLLAFQRAYKVGATTYRAVKLVDCSCSEDAKAKVDGEWTTGHYIPEDREGTTVKGIGRYPNQHELLKIHTYDCPQCGVQVS